MSKARFVPSTTEAARQLVFEQGADPSGSVPEFIARSWARCAALLDNSYDLRPQRVDSRLLAERREAQERLRRIAEPEMNALAEIASDGDGLVLLADAEGLILDSAGGLGFLRKAAQVALQPGVLWSEQSRGTNAIGTALAEGRPVAVRGRQHYLEANGILSCAAAPILSPRGELIAVLDVSGCCERLHSQALYLVRLAIQVLEHRLTSDLVQPTTRMRFQRRPELLGSHCEGVLILNDTMVVGANRAALALLDTNWSDLLETPVARWLKLPAAGKGLTKLSIPGGRRQFHGVLEGPSWGSASLGAAGSRRGASTDEDFVCSAPDDGTGRDEHFYLDGITRSLLERARRVLDAGMAVLVTGETGVGKEVFARHLHRASRRSQGPFVAVNCAALPESLIESELFGYESGAFTGARRSGARGWVREADGGVLFLDEVGDMPLALQPRLLRVLQAREVVPLGGGQPVRVDFDLICATNCDLAAAMAAGDFRTDLYYRIQDFSLRLLPLREWNHRSRLIVELLARLGGEENNITMGAAALRCLEGYAWPGNLRQLISTLRTLLALSDPDDIIGWERLPPEIQADSSADFPSREREFNRQTDLIDQALAASDGCVSAAARRLGIHRSTIYRRLASKRP